jgi:hypothetical protein
LSEAADGNAEPMPELLEREQKWVVDTDFALPQIDDLDAHLEVHSDTAELANVYHDTADQDLYAHGIVVRRCDGDDDTGWQLELPAKDGRLELHWPLSDTPPAELSRLLAGVTLGKELSSVTTIRTSRRRNFVATVEVCGPSSTSISRHANRSAPEDARTESSMSSNRRSPCAVTT